MTREQAKELLPAIQHLKDMGYTVGKTRKRKQSLYKCHCGVEFTTLNESVSSGHTKSCGCMKNKPTHNESKTRLYNIWCSMKDRCYNTNVPNYKDYGGRGIGIYHPWLTYENFSKWAKKNGYDDKLSIDRIDNELGYHPKNCRWVTQSVQNANKRKRRDFIGVRKTNKSTKFEFRIGFKGKVKTIGGFLSKQEASDARDLFIIENNLPHTLNKETV